MVNGNLEECLRFKQSFAFVDIPLRSMCGTWTTSTICNYKEDQMHLRQLPGTSLMQQFDASVGAFFFSSETSDCGYDTRNGFTTMPAAFAFGTVRFSPYHFTGKERDTESGNDYFFARYYSSAMGRFLSPDWASNPQAVPYGIYTNPQTLNLYNYMRNNPLSGIDKDGHCGGPNDPCSKVTVTATPASQPAPVHETTVTDKDKISHTGTGPTATLNMTVSVNGTPTDGVHVTETNQATLTTPGQTTTGKPVLNGATDSTNGGKYSDVVGPTIPSSKMSSEAAAKAYNNTPATLVDKQTQTLQFPGQGGQPGYTCEATSTRTVTNTPDGTTISPGGYTLTTTQPVVTSPQ